MFDQRLLVEVLKDYTPSPMGWTLADSMTTAWTLDGMSLVGQNVSYLAISHVWSDGTGSGAWEPGEVNKCLWEFWVSIARQLGCDAVWWDTVCVPREQPARSIALNRMHDIYAAAKYTVVHDLYLAGIEWKDDGSPCIALVLSPWFTRGWTALELLLSYKVLVLFRQGRNGYTLKNLDTEILAKHRFLDSHAHWIATEAVRRLRPSGAARLKSAYEILSVLQARNTSWDRDVKIIAGLMCGIGGHASLSEEEVTKEILRELRNTWINPNCLLHGLPTMSEPQFSWCPRRFIDIPSGRILQKAHLSILEDGTLDGLFEIWVIPSETDGVIWPMNKDKDVSTQVQSTLRQKPKNCVILTCELFDSKGVLVTLKDHKETDKVSRENGSLYCKYIGVVGVDSSEIRLRQHKPGLVKHVIMGYEPGMVDVGVVDWVLDPMPEAWGIGFHRYAC